MQPRMIECPAVIYWFLLLIFWESRKQEKCQKIGNWAHGMILFIRNLVIKRTVNWLSLLECKPHKERTFVFIFPIDVAQHIEHCLLPSQF